MTTSDRPLVTVVVPTRNRAGLVPRAIRSIMQQTYRPIELIVVDDASVPPLEPPTTSGVELRLVRHRRHQGPGAARNTGAALASGAFISFLDDDDEYLPDRIERAIAEIGNHLMHACPTSENTIRYAGDLRHSLLHDATPSVTQVVYRRDCLEQFDPTLRLGEDVEWWIRMADRADFAWSDAVGVIIHQHDGDRPGADPLVHARCREQILYRHWHRLDHIARQRQLNRVASLYLVAGRRIRSLRFSLRSTRYGLGRRNIALIGSAILKPRRLIDR